MSDPVTEIVILGGGSAGWITAGIIAADHRTRRSPSIQVTLVESPDVPTIGVGEGTWPSMRSTLEKIGIKESDFLRNCSASFKQGSKFRGWLSGQPDDVYHHPFTVPEAYAESNLYSVWREERAKSSFAHAVSVQPHICDLNLAPKQLATPQYAGVLNYGYHLDAGKFAEILRKRCVEDLGVRHLQDHVTEVISADNGDIRAIATASQGLVTGHLFIDCSGSRGVLIDEHFGVPFVSRRDQSINDRALAIQVPYATENEPIESATLATAQTCGWIWDIGLQSRRGVGHVYSSSHISDDEAEAQLRRYIASSVGNRVAEALSVKRLMINAGHRAEFWHRNCVAVGMAAGFIEPLEASALALVEMSATMISEELPTGQDALKSIARRFNHSFTYRWTRVVDFLKLHYVLSRRRDSDYWRDASRAESVSGSLQELISVWKYRSPYYNDFPHKNEIFPSASYQYVLYGMQFDTRNFGLSTHGVREANAREAMQRVAQSVAKIRGALPSNRQLLAQICHSA